MSTEVTETVKFTPSVLDGQAVNDGIMRQIANAETVDELFAGSKTLSLEDLAEGETVRIANCQFHEAAEQYKDGGWGMFSVITLDDGRVITTGAKTVVLKLYKLQEMTGFPLPFDVYFTSTKTRRNFNVWDMQKVDTDTDTETV